MLKARRALVGLAIIPALAAGMMASVAVAQAPKQIPSITVRPVGTDENDPNGGQWFVENLNPLDTKTFQVRLHNPAEVAQKVKLYLADMRFDDKGVPEVTNVPNDIGLWGRFAHPNVTIPPRKTIVETFSITAPKDADPGDHVGAVVAEHTPQGNGPILSVKRVAIRLYATLPGDARRDFVIDKVTVKKDSAFFAKELTVTVQLRNTGRVRLEPTVEVDGVNAKGPGLMVSNSIERYVVTRPVKFWGGPMRLRIDAQTRSLGLAGPVRQARVTTWVIPWHLFALMLLAAGLGWLVRIGLRRRASRYVALQSDLRRLERMLAQQNRETPVAEMSAERDDAKAAIRTAIKQAKRAGDLVTAERLEAVLKGTPGVAKKRAASNGRARR
jgi:hypothetical protein